MNIKIIILHNIRQKASSYHWATQKIAKNSERAINGPNRITGYCPVKRCKNLKKNKNKTKKIAENHKLKAKTLDKVKGIFNFWPNF